MTATTETRTSAWWLGLFFVLLYWLTFAAIAWYTEGPIIGVSGGGVTWAALWTVIILTGLVGGALFTGFGRLSRDCAEVFGFLIVIAMAAQIYAEWRGLPRAFAVDEKLVLGITLFPFAIGVPLLLLTRRPGWIRGAAACACVTVALYAAQVLLPQAPVFQHSGVRLSRVAPQPTAAEYASAQGPLLKEQTEALLGGRNGKTELYGLLVAGWADQSVFLSEAEGVRQILEEQYGAGARTIILANSLVAPLRYPEVSWDNLIGATQALSDAMGPEDVLFLLLTSHGRADGFGLTFHPAASRARTGMRAQDLAELLDRYHDGPAVVAVSACKSGSFVDDFARPDRLVITASAAERNSFGCRDGADWTRFGHYFFNVSLRAEPDPRKAFAAALPLIEDAEWWQPWAKASQPQISVGSDVGPILDGLLAAGAAQSN